MSTQFQFTTDTSTLCVFDLAALRHRFEEDADWWVHPPSVQLSELNASNAAFIDLGADGSYSGTLEEEVIPSPSLVLVLSCPSGSVFVGAAEETTAEGMEPDCSRGGLLLSIQPGTYQLSLARQGARALRMSLSLSQARSGNGFTSPLRLAESAA
ncbi:hypothetical protein HZ992_14985 [Rhizobacter sp. AJA081-3]|uniref:DUF6386 family protein n=1 Tax=Rhizobacter sp. AJA081-3 TaxID=2753607 RepID=UPI001AE0A261|nr:DUF6386 family protein [Rhizobacter sp. AJA081-3]QTN21451.1 hypothetical protein HZ992_14790 [Rhizobacter sp. AJA081-3]QTN21489.1 hypothetical protein HZ992_14985 [Rhizobacter sp. AJA081-3]